MSARALRHEQATRLVRLRQGLLVEALGWNEAHVRPADRLANPRAASVFDRFT